MLWPFCCFVTISPKWSLFIVIVLENTESTSRKVIVQGTIALRSRFLTHVVTEDSVTVCRRHSLSCAGRAHTGLPSVPLHKNVSFGSTETPLFDHSHVPNACNSAWHAAGTWSIIAHWMTQSPVLLFTFDSYLLMKKQMHKITMKS